MRQVRGFCRGGWEGTGWASGPQGTPARCACPQRRRHFGLSRSVPAAGPGALSAAEETWVRGGKEAGPGAWGWAWMWRRQGHAWDGDLQPSLRICGRREGTPFGEEEGAGRGRVGKGEAQVSVPTPFPHGHGTDAMRPAAACRPRGVAVVSGKLGSWPRGRSLSAHRCGGPLGVYQPLHSLSSWAAGATLAQPPSERRGGLGYDVFETSLSWDL